MALTLVLPPLVLVMAVLWYARGIPLPPDELSAQTTFVYDANGVLLAHGTETCMLLKPQARAAA